MEHMGITYHTQKMTQRIRGFHHTNAPACRISQWGAPNHETARKLWRTACATRWKGKCCFPKAPSKWLHNGKAGKRGRPVSCRLYFGRCFGRVTDLAYAMRPYLDISSYMGCLHPTSIQMELGIAGWATDVWQSFCSRNTQKRAAFKLDYKSVIGF